MPRATARGSSSVERGQALLVHRKPNHPQSVIPSSRSLLCAKLQCSMIFAKAQPFLVEGHLFLTRIFCAKCWLCFH